MAQPRYSAVGDYVVGKQIGAGSFSTVWHGHHRVNGSEVAIKEIATARLNPKLQESLKSEIFILKRINHLNIIRLYDVIEEPGYLYIVLEYCKGGDLSMYIHKRHGEVSKATAKHFMQQLAEGLKVLRENNVIHRDLKPQNLLLSTNDDSTILKIADFGFARSLQPRDVAETLCGSPLYMAPEILQLQKYDAKADLWSVGTILFQLVTGKTPFTGCNQMQLLQNIIKSTELQFPPDAKDLSPHCLDLCRKLLRRNPVERLTFEEFFNHPYLSKKQHIDSSSQPERVSDGSSISGRNTGESSQKDSLSPSRDNESCLPVCSSPKRSAMRSMHGLSLDSKSELRDYLNLTNRTVADSLELIIKDYVIVSGHPLDLSYTGGCASNQEHFPSNDDLPLVSEKINKTSSSMLIRSGATHSVDGTRSLGSYISFPSTSQGPRDIKQPSSDSMTRVKSLQCYATSLSELVKGKAEKGKHLEAFSIQLVILSIWKQALDICQTYAASATEGNPSEETASSREVSNTQHNPDAQEFHDISSQIERSFLHEVENSEELAKVIEPGNAEMPDAMELIYQSALAFGKRGAVDEYMGDNGNAVAFYSNAARLLQFLDAEAPRLALNPPFSLTVLARHRIRVYIYMLNDRRSILECQRMAPPMAADKGPSCPSSNR